MKRFVVNVANSAVLAMHEQALFITADKPIVAAKWLEKLWDRIESLENFPHRNPIPTHESYSMGFEVPKLVIGNYLIFYRVDEEQSSVEVIRFRHAARLPEEL